MQQGGNRSTSSSKSQKVESACANAQFTLRWYRIVNFTNSKKLLRKIGGSVTLHERNIYAKTQQVTRHWPRKETFD